MSDSIVSERQKFKRTPVGNIPVDWAVKSIGELAECAAGGTPQTSIPEYWNGDIRWMNSGELNLKRVREVEGRITEAGLQNSNAKIIPIRCVLIGLAGQGKTRGTVAMNLIELCTNQSIAAILPTPAFIPEFLYYNLDSRYGELRGLSGGESGRGGLNLSTIRSILVPLPPLPEQREIAAILSSVDRNIEIVRETLAKRRVLKRGVIEEIFKESSKWPQVTFGKAFEFIRTANNSRADLSAEKDIGYIHYGDIHTKWRGYLDCSRETLPQVASAKVKRIPRLKNGDLIMVDASEDYEGLGSSIEIINADRQEAVAGLHTMLLRDSNKRFADGYRGCIQYIPRIREALQKVATGTSVYGISKSNLSRIAIPCPPISRQKEIVTVLAAIDSPSDGVIISRLFDIRAALIKLLMTGRMRVR